MNMLAVAIILLGIGLIGISYAVIGIDTRLRKLEDRP